MIKEIYTITNTDINSFRRDVDRIVKDLQSDGYKVDVQFSTSKRESIIGMDVNYSAMIIGREK